MINENDVQSDPNEMTQKENQTTLQQWNTVSRERKIYSKTQRNKANKQINEAEIINKICSSSGRRTSIICMYILKSMTRLFGISEDTHLDSWGFLNSCIVSSN